MKHILYIEFGKSRSAKFKNVVALAKALPGFKEINEIYSIQINTIKEYLFNYDTINEVIDTVRFWKHSTILLYGKTYRNSNDYYDFQSELERNAGKYAIILNKRKSVTVESLPLPIVFYPSLYGAFFAFAEDIGEQIYFCECEKKAISNYFRLKNMNDNKCYINNKQLLGREFPEVVIEMSNECTGNLEEQILYKKA